MTSRRKRSPEAGRTAASATLRAARTASRRRRPAAPADPGAPADLLPAPAGVSGSVADAAARAGITPRTVQRWRAANATFARRYEEVLSQRLEILEDLAMRRALGADRRPVFHRGEQVASVERHNDAMLMRLLARFDRLRDRQARTGGRHGREGYLDDMALLDAAGERARQEADPAAAEEP